VRSACVLQCGAVCCSFLEYVVTCCSMSQCVAVSGCMLSCVAVSQKLLRFLGILQYKFKWRFWFNLTVYRGGFQGCSIFRGICHNRKLNNKLFCKGHIRGRSSRECLQEKEKKKNELKSLCRVCFFLVCGQAVEVRNKGNMRLVCGLIELWVWCVR